MMSVSKQMNFSRSSPRSHFYLCGSYTVEAALVMGIVMLVLFATMRMTFWLTDSVRMEAVLSEASVNTVAGEAWTQTAGGFFLLDASGIQMDTQSSQVTFSSNQGPFQLWPGGQSYFDAAYVCEIRQPVTFLRRCRLLASLK